MSSTLIDILKQVVTSWQVIVITVVIILYLNLVFFISRKYRRPNTVPRLSLKSNKPKPEKTAEIVTETGSGKNSNEELGLEEE